MISSNFLRSPGEPCGFDIICSNESRSGTSISDTIGQYCSEQKSVMTRIFGIPTFSLSFDIATNFSTIARTLPGLQYMISRIRNMFGRSSFGEFRIVALASLRPSATPSKLGHQLPGGILDGSGATKKSATNRERISESKRARIETLMSLLVTLLFFRVSRDDAIRARRAGAT